MAEKVGLPAMVVMDGFITSHSVENLETLTDEQVKNFVGEYEPKDSLLNFQDPKTFGAVSLPDSYFEFKVDQEKMLEKAVDIFQEVSEEYYEMFKNGDEKRFGTDCKIHSCDEEVGCKNNDTCTEKCFESSGLRHTTSGVENFKPKKSDVFECYKVDDAEKVIVAAGSVAGTIKDVVDEKRNNGEKVGLLKIELFRPFPFEKIASVLKNVKKVAVMDRSLASGSKPPIYSDLASVSLEKNCNFSLRSYVYGLGGRDVFEKDIEGVFEDMDEEGDFGEVRFLGSEK